MNEGLVLLELAARELLLFAGVFIVAGSVGEATIDTLWLAMRLIGRGEALQFVPLPNQQLRSRAAVLIPCWDEAAVIGDTLRRCSEVWPYSNLTFLVGCCPNDPATQAAVRPVAMADPCIRMVVMPHPGGTTKADCLNTLWQAATSGVDVPDFIVLHDAEDIVHPDALALIEDRLERAEFVQLPVLPLIRRGGRMISGHYPDEFAESNGRRLRARPVDQRSRGDQPLRSRGRSRRQADRDARVFPSPLRRGGAPEGAIAQRDHVSGVGPDGLGRFTARSLDALA